MADKSLLRANSFYRENPPQVPDTPYSPPSPLNKQRSSSVSTFDACLRELTSLRRSNETRKALDKDSVDGSMQEPIVPPNRKDPATWAGDSPDRIEFVKAMETQLARGAGKTGVIALTYVAREHLHNPTAIAAFRDPVDPPPLPANVTTVYVPNTEWKNAFDAYKRSGGIPEQVSIRLLPQEVVDQCEHAPLWHCEKITDTLVTQGASEAVTVAEQFAAYKKWQRTNDSTMTVAARISGTAIRSADGLPGRVLLTDLEQSPNPPPLLPPCVKEIYVRDKKSADAYKTKYPDVTILCLETLSEALQERGEEQPIDFDPITKQYIFAKSSKSPERCEPGALHHDYRRCEPEESHDDYRRLAEFKLNARTSTPL
jgi:hypothetical protein